MAMPARLVPDMFFGSITRIVRIARKTWTYLSAFVSFVKAKRAFKKISKF